MSTKFKTVITTAGAVKLAAATLPGGKKINITAMAVGDGGGILPVPDAGQTRLVNEVWRHALNKISQDNRHSNYIVAELVIPPEVGGFWMRELGLYDDEGTLIAVSNMAESYKPELAEGSGRAQTCRMVIIVSSVASVALSIDSTMVMATQDYVDDAISAHEKSRRHPDATTQEKGFTQLSNATDSESETLAATPRAVKSAFDLARSKYTAQDASTVQKGLVQLSNATDSEADSLAATPKAVKIAMDNASARLAKERNGADIPNKPLFVQNIGLQDTVNRAANAVQRTGDTMSWLNVTGLSQSGAMRVNSAASPSVQGLTIDWNGVGFGAAGLTNNRGLGTGGFIFRTVDAENKIEYGRVTFNELGEIFAGRNIYAGSAKFAIDGNSYGTIWGTGGNSEWLSNNLNARFGAIPVNNATGDISGPAWGGLLSAHLSEKWRGIQSQFAALPVDNPSGNIRGSAWGNDWLSNYLARTFQPRGDYTPAGEAYTKEASDGRFLRQTGGTLSGQVVSTSPDNYRLRMGDRAFFFRFDGSAFYLMKTAKGDPDGLWDNTRPLIVDAETGRVTLPHMSMVDGFLKVGNTGTVISTDGNIFGTRWGEGGAWMGDAIDARMNAVQARADDAWNKAHDAQINRVVDVRFTAEHQVGAYGVRDYRNGNTVMTGFVNGDADYSAEDLYWSYIQVYRNGQWLTIGRG